MEGALTLSWRDMGRTAGILCAASLVGLLFYKAGITEANIVTVYLLAVLCTALATDGRVYGISAAVASVLVFNYLFTVPRFTLKFNDESRYSVTFLVMFIAACITSTLTMRVKTQARQAARKAHRSEVLLETSQALQRAEGEQQIFTAAAEHLSRLLRAGVSLYPVRDGALQPPLVCDAQGTEAAPCTTERELRAARTVLRCGGQAGARTAACPDAECLYLAVGASVPPLAVAGVALRKGHIPDDFDRNLMAALLNECALALEKERIAREKSDAELQAQQEQLEQIMEQRSIYQYRSGQERLPVSESAGQYAAAVAAPILCGGDVLGLVLFISAEDRLPGEGEYKLAQAVAGFLGKHMET